MHTHMLHASGCHMYSVQMYIKSRQIFADIARRTGARDASALRRMGWAWLPQTMPPSPNKILDHDVMWMTTVQGPASLVAGTCKS